jgi:hypothetical protein
VLAFPLVVAAVLTPLAIRNWDYYDRFVPAGASLGINVFAGLNKYYVNPDYNCDPDLVWRVHRDQDGQLDFVGRHFLEYGDGWKNSDADNPIDAGRDNLEIALRYALEHPGGFFLTRTKKAADLATPLSFMVRDLSPEVYSGVLVSPPLRRTVIALSLVSVVVLLSLSWVNLVRIRGRRQALLFFLLIFGYVGTTAMLVSMSRFRIPAVPFMLVLVGATLVEQPGPRRAVTLSLGAAGLLVLLLLWLMNLGEVSEVVARSWG